MSVDLRSRRDSACTQQVRDPDDFFNQVLPAALEQHRELLAPGVIHRAMKPFSFEVEGELWTLVCDPQGAINVVSGTLADAAHVRLGLKDLNGLVLDWYTPMTFFTGGSLDLAHGQLEDFLDCWLILRGALDGTAIYTPGTIDFVDAHGQALDLQRSFRSDDNPAEMAHFLQQAGFLHLTNVFSTEEMARISADMDAAAPRYFEGDNNSWWATTADGNSRLVRMQRFDHYSETTRQLLQDDCFLNLAKLTGDGHQQQGATSDNRIEALIKPLHVVKGISDLPWHKDCALGRHSYDCCSITAGISVTGADANSGQLRVVAGSHRGLMWPALTRADKQDLPVIDLPTQCGDITLHLSCTLHMAQAPVSHERRVLYTGFSLPEGDPRAAALSRQRISTVREGAHTTVSQ
jgi:hypothetical protein